jgi:hypothetical protein
MENRILKRQLKRLGLDAQHAPDQESWHAFLSRLDQIFIQNDQDQYLLQQSLTTLSKETQELYKIYSSRRKAKSNWSGIGCKR